MNGNTDGMSLNTLPTIPSITFESEEDYAGWAEDFAQFNRDNKQTNGFTVVGYKDVHEEHFSNTDDPQTYLLGLQQALSMYLGGSAYMYFDGTGGFQIHQTGNAQQYLTNAPLGTSDGTFVCGYQYMDPINSPGRYDWILNNVVLSINQIMFTLATDPLINNASYPDGIAPLTSYNATLRRTNIHYVTHTPYMWGAFASMLVCVLLILPTYWGFWQLGRKVSLGPFEIAHAFRSPMTAAARNGNVDEMLKEVGHRKVQYVSVDNVFESR
jgi:hypothetical protein